MGSQYSLERILQGTRDVAVNSLRVLASWGFALGLTWWLVPRAMALAQRTGLVDHPGGRKTHAQPTPLLGGLAMAVPVLLAGVLLAPAAPGAVAPAGAVAGAGAAVAPWVLPAAALLAFLVGLVDDFAKSRRRDLGAAAKLAGQLAPALLLVAAGVEINYFTNPFGGGVIYLPDWLDIPLTLCWLVGMTNAVNFIDGLDGLAAGVVGVAAFTLAIVALALGQIHTAVWVAAVLGACMGFLRYNFPPARIFMGDAGSNFLGFTVAAIALSGYFKTATLAGLVVPLFALSLPVLNGFFVVIRRMARGRSLIQALSVPDREHSFDVLRRKGFNTMETVLIFLLVAMALSAAGMGLALRP